MAEEGTDEFLREIDELLGDEGSGGRHNETKADPVVESPKTT